MANYYNMVGWKHTGFDFYNRPLNRDVLNQAYFTDSSNYFQLKGIMVKREDMMGIKYIDVQGSVKDVRGDQINPANVTGSQGPGGPWYSWEEVDYVRLTRTGYPGDEDFVDISSNVKEPWKVSHSGKLFVAYYFVTGMEPLGRNVTRIYLSLDEWTTMGGSEELEIESGFKVRGHITEAEDAAGYNLAPESIGLIEPLEVKSHGELDIQGDNQVRTIYVSATDLTQYDEDNDTIDGFVIQATSSADMIIPKIKSVDSTTFMAVNTPNGDTETQKITEIKGYGFFDGDNSKVKHNLSVLFSAGQLELMDSYEIPKKYIATGSSPSGRLLQIENEIYRITNPTTRDVGGYPRKADYLFGQDVLYAKATGDLKAFQFAELTNRNIYFWSVPTPGGSTIARFQGIKNHPYVYDETVKGMTWMKSAVTLQGASGSMWNQVNNLFSEATLQRAKASNNMANQISDYNYEMGKWQRPLNTAGQVVGALTGAKDGQIGGAFTSSLINVANAGFDEAKVILNRQGEMLERDIREKSLNQAKGQLNASMFQAEMKAPHIEFVPDLNSLLYTDNGFGCYVINTTTKDRTRLKNYFKRYGYNGLYKPLTWNEINVKQKVNYIECESVCLKHAHYPTRMTMATSEILRNGLFLWNEKPNQAAFDNNPDN